MVHDLVAPHLVSGHIDQRTWLVSGCFVDRVVKTTKKANRKQTETNCSNLTTESQSHGANNATFI